MLKILTEPLPRSPPSLGERLGAGLGLRPPALSFAARRWLALAVVGGLVLFAATFSASRIVRALALEEVRRAAQTTADLHAAVLRIELEKYRSVPFVMGADAEVRQALEVRGAANSARLDHKLAMLSKEVRVRVIYVLDALSFGIADSNPRLKPNDRLCSTRCKDRYYYTEAMKTGRAELFALGRADRVPGLYISHAIDSPTGRLGVAVVKVTFDKLEGEWGAGRDPTFVTDRNGVVIISSVPQWRMTTFGALAPRVRAELARTGQFGDNPLPVMPDLHGGDGSATAALTPGGRAQSFVVASTPIEGEGWTLHLMKPTSPSVDAAQLAAGAIAFLCGLLGLVVAALFLHRDDRRRAEAVRQVAAREELEARVASRTSELSAANGRLVEEIDERRRMAESLHVLQDELVQANKLAMLGQIAAGVAHEINQPVAAIKTYAHNAGKFLSRDQPGQVKKNLGIIGDLTDRISVITNELRAFSRRTSGGGGGPAPVSEAIDGALLLVSHRLKHEGVRLVRKETPGLMAMAERIRLEQVLVNLLQNALDACGAQEDAVIELTAGLVGGPAARSVRITVTDNGPGLTPAALDSLFMPFVTTKPKGLGLGLVISRDIIAEFGGDLAVVPSAAGASFVVTLRRAA